MSDLLQMSQAELTRLDAMKSLETKRLTQAQVAQHLHLSVRQVKRLWHAYRSSGPPALLSQRRGRPSNHQLAPELKAEALHLIQRHYPDFGPTLAHEKLCAVHHLQLSVETVRQLMIDDGLWRAQRARRAVAHQSRERRARSGELVQIDGSPHDWFEGRAPRCTLLVFIDDATGSLRYLQFVPAETTWTYFAAVHDYLLRYGRPLAFYSDKFSVFRLTADKAVSGNGLTQFGRALQELDIKLICANTPQAKGRVERANQTLQDRLVKELRLQGIDDMAGANAFLPTFMQEFNARFARTPQEARDAHRPLARGTDLERILSLQEERVLSKNLTLQYNKVLYQIQTTRPHYALRKAVVVVCEQADGRIRIDYKGKTLDYTVFQQQARQAQIVTPKELATKELATSKPTGKTASSKMMESPGRSGKTRPAKLPEFRSGLRSPSLAPDHPWRRQRIGRRTPPTSQLATTSR